VRNLKKYGLDDKKAMKFVKDSQRIMKQEGWRGTLFRMAYGTPAGATGLIASKAMGANWIQSVAVGASIGYLSSYLTNLARTLKLSPDVIEHMLEERELPGRQRVGKGKFGEPLEGELVEERPGGGPSGFRPGEPQIPLSGAPQLPGMAPASERRTEPSGPPSTGERRTIPHQYTQADLPALVKKTKPVGAKESPVFEGTRKGVEAKRADVSEVGRTEGKRPGTTKESPIGRRTKARERVEKQRAEAGRTRQKEQIEAESRARSTGMDVSQIQIPEMEEALQRMAPENLKSLQKMRKAKGISDPEYIEGLKFYILEAYEKGQ
jgi:hypothetical protein